MTFACFSSLAQKNEIVFVCEHGSAKSVIAAAYFNKLANERNLPWRAVARGTHPDSEISSKTNKLLEQDGLLDNTFKPRLLLREMSTVRRRFTCLQLCPRTYAIEIM